MKLLKTLTLLTVLFSLSTVGSYAQTLLNGDFSTPSTNGDDMLTGDELDNGWYYYSSTTQYWTLNTGQAERITSSQPFNPRGFGQIFTSSYTDSYTFSFDYDFIAKSSADGLTVQVFGIDEDSPGAAWLTGQGDGVELTLPEAAGHYGNHTYTALIDQTISGNDATAVQGTYTTTIDFGASGYDFVSVAFYLDTDNQSGQYGIIDNVSLSAVPEPSAYAMLAFGTLALLGVSLVRRHFSVA